MRTALISAFTICACLFTAEANSIIVIGIATTDDTPKYSVNGKQMTLSEIGPWMKRCIEVFGDKDPVFVQPDARTTFASVYTLLELLKDSGLKDVNIEAERSQTATSFIQRTLSIKLESLTRSEYDSPPRIPELKIK